MPHSPSLYPIMRHPWEEAFSTAMAPGTPTNPDICSFTRPFLSPPGFQASSFPPHGLCQSNWPVYRGTGRQTPASPPPVPWKNEFARRADCQRSCFTDWSGGKGGYDKDDSLCGGTLSAAATRNLFRKNRILYTMVVGVKKGGTY